MVYKKLFHPKGHDGYFVFFSVGYVVFIDCILLTGTDQFS